MRHFLTHQRTKAIETVILTLLFCFGVVISLFYGRLGFMPIDQSIVFDGGWRILSGQIPFREFTTPTGIVPIFMQAGFFGVFGISWFVYCLHAAVINGIFCILVYLLLRMLRLSSGYAFLYGILSGIVMYPPFGTPYMEQHGFFFLLLAIVVLLKAQMTHRESIKALLLILLPFCLLCTYLSKQNIALFGLLPIIITCSYSFQNWQWKTLLKIFGYCTFGVVLCALTLFTFFHLYAIDLQKLHTYFFQLPYQIGAPRLKAIGISGLLGYPFQVLTAETVSPPIVVLIACAGMILILSRLFRKNVPDRRALFLTGVNLALAASLMLVCVYFVMSTNNQKQNGFPYIFVSIGIVHSCMVSLASSAHPRLMSKWLSIFFIALALRDAYYFNSYVNAHRIVHEMFFDRQTATQPQTPALAFMIFQVAQRYYRFTVEDLDFVVEFFRQKPGNFLLIGDSSILYGLTQRPSPSPSLWFHNGLTVPESGTPEFESYQAELIQNLRRYEVKYIVLESSGTIRGTNLQQFPELGQLLRNQRVTMYQIGEFRILELT